MTEPLTLDDLISMLEDYRRLHPQAADRPIRVYRTNGRRSFRHHTVESIGCSTIFDPESVKNVTIKLSEYEGTKY